MADFINVSLESSSDASLSLAAYNNGREDPNLYFKVRNPSSFIVQPQETVRALIVPQSDPLTAADASGLLADPNSKRDVSRGIYYTRYVNDESSSKTLTELPIIRLADRAYENVPFDLYWYQSLDSNVIFNSDTAGVYSFPHNIQPHEVRLEAQLINNNTKMRYNLTFSEFNNTGDANYTGSNQPYLLSISYRWDPTSSAVVSGVFGGSAILFSGRFDFEPFPSGTYSGVAFDIPFYDTRTGFDGTPAQYVILLNNNCADPSVTGSFPLAIPLNHQELADSQIVDLDTYISTNVDPDKLRRADEVLVDRGTIDRTRLSIGVKDIAIKQNSYKKKGVFISKPYISDFPIYTFSFRVKEYIPEYAELEQYDAVKYFIEFNNRPWERISPVTRTDEIDENGNIVPKLFIFDKGPTESESTVVKYLNYGASVINFRVKIVFDISRVTGNQFIAPEIRDYECILFDKTQLLEL